MNLHAVQVIDALGGTAEVARICEVSMPSVSNWKHDGIPSARVMFLSVAHAAALKGIDLKAATATRRPTATAANLDVIRQSNAPTTESIHG